jgi:FKBP-type peptidyl-prolyl cis-trans isomerase FkpA
LKSKDGFSCAYQDRQVTVPAAERDSVAAYLDSNNIVATLHPAGFYYSIVNPGEGTDSARLCSQIAVNYKGQLANDSIFDKANGAYFVLGSLIEAWRKAIPLIKKGGEINLYVPPSLGYGNEPVTNSGVVVIPAKSILIFNVKLLDYTAGN